MKSRFSGLFGSSSFETTPAPGWFQAHPATIDVACSCGAAGRVEANTVAGAKALAAQFYKAHANHPVPESGQEQTP